MGWVTIEYEQRHDVLKDFDLWTLKHFFVKESKEWELADPDVAVLRLFFERWDWLGPGVIVGIDFEGFLRNSDSRKQSMLDLFRKTSERLNEFGGAIPFAYLVSHVNEPGREYVSEQAVGPFVDAIQRIRELIS